MSKNKNQINAKDCSIIENQNLVTNDLISKLQDFEEFSMFGKKRDEEREPLLSFDYKFKKWRASRYVGETTFLIGNNPVEIRIVPRFFPNFLNLLLEEIFNIKLTNSGSTTVRNLLSSPTIKILISYIWLLKLGKANRHGLPKVKYTEFHSGSLIKGKLELKKSIPSILTKGEATYSTRSKNFDETILGILHQAYRFLVKDYQLGKCSTSELSKQAIQQIETLGSLKRISPNEYHSIQYHSIYESFKPVVDLSWRIIQSKLSFENGSTNENINGFFLDMAEIWETYIRSYLKKKLAQAGWELLKDMNFKIYEDQYFARSLIPDIIFRRGNEVIVLDAKYKENVYKNYDLDRTDLFQIHTYVSYLQSNFKVRFAGLVYPMQSANSNSIPTNLYSIENNETLFLADGPIVANDKIDWDLYLDKINEIIK